ncbi:MAG: hypothetical protein RBR67_20125 [Desulfobacterium sp.]|nr:hypothetical protein [Desulfobacterium sp.]
MLEKESPFGEEELFRLHKAVQTQVVIDVYKPVSAWKKEHNSTVGGWTKNRWFLSTPHRMMSLF